MVKVCVIGLGYVGLPLACLCARKGHKVTGIDINEAIVNKINLGISHIQDEFLIKELKEIKLDATANGSEELKKAEVIIVCVPTPIDHKFHPNLEYIESAGEIISKNIQRGQLIILESTVHPGTTDNNLKIILEKSGLKAGIDFYLAHCPERIDPGNKKWPLIKIPRVVGGINLESGIKAKEFYASILESEILILSGSKEAEATKIMENSFRDINIAFINEMAKSFDKAGIDIKEVIRGASTKPFAFLAHFPGCGVGGHCIPIDPYYLIEKAKDFRFEHRFLELARKINESMPEYTINLLSEELNKLGRSIKDARIGLYGLAYKKDIDDIRESPALELERMLKEKEAHLIVYDPYVKRKSTVNSFEEFLNCSDYILIATNHSEITNLDVTKFADKQIKLIIDGRNCLDKERILKLGIRYKGIGS